MSFVTFKQDGFVNGFRAGCAVMALLVLLACSFKSCTEENKCIEYLIVEEEVSG